MKMPNKNEFFFIEALGVGKFIRTKEVNGETLLEFEIESDGSIIPLSLENFFCGAIKPLPGQNEIDEFFSILKTHKPIASDSWNTRYRSLLDKASSHSLKDLAEVISELLALQSSNKLAFGEKKMLEAAITRAESLIIHSKHSKRQHLEQIRSIWAA